MGSTINNNIQDSFCSFEVSKLLREKGFNVPCSTHWEWGNGDLKNGISPGIFIGGFLNEESCPRNYCNSELMSSYTEGDNLFGEFSRPTHAVATEWIKQNFNILIQSMLYRRNPNDYICGIYFNKLDSHFTEPCNSPQEAIEFGLLYTLKNIVGKWDSHT